MKFIAGKGLAVDCDSVSSSVAKLTEYALRPCEVSGTLDIDDVNPAAVL